MKLPERDVFGLNKRAYNTALMDGVQLPTGRQCELDWTQQNLYQLTMLKDKQLAKGLDEAIELADRYTGNVISPLDSRVGGGGGHFFQI